MRDCLTFSTSPGTVRKLVTRSLLTPSSSSSSPAIISSYDGRLQLPFIFHLVTDLEVFVKGEWRAKGDARPAAGVVVRSRHRGACRRGRRINVVLHMWCRRVKVCRCRVNRVLGRPWMVELERVASPSPVAVVVSAFEPIPLPEETHRALAPAPASGINAPLWRSQHVPEVRREVARAVIQRRRVASAPIRRALEVFGLVPWGR